MPAIIKSSEPFYHLTVAGCERDLAICPLKEGLSIASFVILGDVELAVNCAAELLKRAPAHDIMITAESKGIPLLHEMARQSGAPEYLVARKSPKLYMSSYFSVEVQSITTERRQTLYLDGADAKSLEGKQVLIVDDVISTGESIKAVEALIEKAGGVVAGRACILAEGDAADRDDIIFLEVLPLIETEVKEPEVPETLPEEEPYVPQANPGKNESIEVDGGKVCRLAVRTHVVTPADDIAEVAKKYAAPHMKDGDILVCSEKSVACSQRRAIPVADIKPRPLAKFLVKFVYKSPYGIGLGIPETMEMALRECGTLRILFAAACSAVGKLIGKRGWFYKIAGYKAESIDGPTPYTIAPYNKCVVLGPAEPDKVAGKMADAVGHPVAIVDVNDLQAKVLGASGPEVDRAFIARAMKDNPLGQSGQSTPMGIIRRA
ncbi:MAG TPA: phosphoribosyltransferase family protein [Terriglobales bacterium]|nr:phosphoribosyltransferase family protein [Terriglobales bacterium]